MAEIVGTIAAALQLAETALKLKRLHGEIKNAPKDVLELAEEISVLADLLSDVLDIQNTGNGQLVSSSGWIKCCRLFNSSANAMSQLVSELETTLQAHKRSGSIRVLLRAGEVARCKERMERVKGLLTLTQQTYALTLLTQQNSSMLHAIHALTADTPGRTGNIAYHPRPHTSITSSSAVTNADDDDQNQDDPSHAKRRHGCVQTLQSTRAYRLGLPHWVVRKGIEVLYHHGASSWGVHFRTYNRLPPGSELFTLAFEGDWEAIQSLFVSRHASPFDIGPTGTTLLHVAASRVEPDACRMLLKHGLDPCQRDSNDGFNAVEYLADGFEVYAYDYPEEALLETISVLAGASQETVSTPETYSQLYLYGILPPKALHILTVDQLQHEDITDPLRAEWAMMTTSPNPGTIQTILSDKLTLQEAFALVNEHSCVRNHTFLLRAASRNLATAFAVGGTSSKLHVAGWKDVIARIIQFERGNSNFISFHNAYISFIEFYNSELAFSDRTHGTHVNSIGWNEYFTRIGRLWLNVLLELGADLERYGHAEHRSISSNPTYNSFFKRSRHSFESFQFKYLTYGANVDDWKLFVVPKQILRPRTGLFEGDEPWICGDEEYAMVGDFWDWVENPELFTIPGTYLNCDDLDDLRLTHQLCPVMVTGPIL